MNTYQQELKNLRPDDEIQSSEFAARDKGYQFIPTASHGYLVVPKSDKNAHIAKKICQYGYVGNIAYYLEEDSEAGEFIKAIATDTISAPVMPVKQQEPEKPVQDTTDTHTVDIFGDSISVYSTDQAIQDGQLVELFKNRWQQLTHGQPMLATSNIFEAFSLAAFQEMWNEYVTKAKTPEQQELFTTKMNDRTVWIMNDHYTITFMFPEDY